MKIQDMLFTGVGVLHVSKVEELVDNIEFNCWRKGKEETTTPIVAFDYGFLYMQEDADTFPILICRETASVVKRERRVVNGKVPQHTPFYFLLVSPKILVFAESF